MLFVVDNTNPTVAERQKYIELAKAARNEVVGYFFELSTNQAAARISQRSGRYLVPEKALWHAQPATAANLSRRF